MGSDVVGGSKQNIPCGLAKPNTCTRSLKNRGKAEELKNSPETAARLDFILVCVTQNGNYLNKCRLTNREGKFYRSELPSACVFCLVSECLPRAGASQP